MENEKPAINECNVFDIYILGENSNPVRPALEISIEAQTGHVKEWKIINGKENQSLSDPARNKPALHI